MMARWLGIAVVLAVGAGPFAAASPYSDFVINNTSPVLYWGLNEAGGWVAADLAPLGGLNDGSYASATLNNAGMRPPGFPNMGAANVAPSVNRNGGTLYTALNSIAGVGTAAYSMQAWFNSTAAWNTAAVNYIFARGVGPGGGVDLRDSVGVGGSYGLTPTGRLYYFPGGTDDSLLRIGTTVLSTNTWYHTVLVRNGDNIKVYLNGVKEIDTTRPWLGGTGERFTAANRMDFGMNLGLSGLYDEVAVWDRALSPIEARALYLAAFGDTSVASCAYSQAVLAGNPEAYWRLNEIAPVGIAVDATNHFHDFAYPTAPSRTGAGQDVGPRPLAFPGLEDSNNAPRLIRGVENNSYLGNVSGVLPGQNDYSIEMWFRPEQLQVPFGSVYLMHRLDADAGQTNCGDYLGLITVGAQPGPVNLFIFNGDKPGDVPGETFVRGTTSLNLGDWHHVAMTRQDNLVRVYLDGLLEIEAIMPLLAGTKWVNGTWTFGNRLDMLTNNQRFNGNLDEIAIYSAAYDAPFFLGHYQAAMGIPEPASLSLFAVGLSALLVARSRSRGRKPTPCKPLHEE